MNQIQAAFGVLVAWVALSGVSGANSGTEDWYHPIGEAARKTVTLQKNDHILFLGDSLTHRGEGPTGWVTQTRLALLAQFPELGLRVSAVATDGHTVLDLLNRVRRDVLPQHPTVVVIQIGCNDARRIDRESFEDGLDELIRILKAAGIQVVLNTLTSVGERYDGTNDWDPWLDIFANTARWMAVEHKIPLNELRVAFVEYWKRNNPQNKDSGILTLDGNHFNDRGQQWVTGLMLRKFR